MNSTTGVLKINDYRIWAYHGWYEEERMIGGEYAVDVALTLKIEGTSLQLSDTIDYQDVVNLIQVVMAKPYKLIEESCAGIVQAIQEHSSKHTAIKVTVTKLNIPINNLHSTSFTITS